MASVQKQGSTVAIKLDSGHTFSFDTSKHNLSEDQHSALEQAAKALSNVPDSTLLGSGCPAKPHLDPAEFEKLQGLKSAVGSTGANIQAGLIADFCLHVVAV